MDHKSELCNACGAYKRKAVSLPSTPVPLLSPLAPSGQHLTRTESCPVQRQPLIEPIPVRSIPDPIVHNTSTTKKDLVAPPPLQIPPVAPLNPQAINFCPTPVLPKPPLPSPLGNDRSGSGSTHGLTNATTKVNLCSSPVPAMPSLVSPLGKDGSGSAVKNLSNMVNGEKKTTDDTMNIDGVNMVGSGFEDVTNISFTCRCGAVHEFTLRSR